MDFCHEPPHSKNLNVLGKEPFNAEPSVADLVEYSLTPEHLVYCRNHSPILPLNVETFKVKIDGLVSKALGFTLKDLQSGYACTDVVAALQCAGNRRNTMSQKKSKKTEGLQWKEGVICNDRWSGVALRSILLSAGIAIPPDGTQLHVLFGSHIAPCQEASYYETSVPLEKVMDEEGDVLLAYAMNGRPLTPDRGYPFRLVIPGYAGVRWTKWVDRITVSSTESDNFYQQRDYKILPPNVNSHSMAEKGSWWSKVVPLQTNPLNSVVANVTLHKSSRPSLSAKGYAIAGSTGQVQKVEISTDDGATWLPARITYQEGKWSWTLWEADIEVAEDGAERLGVRKVISRATDESGRIQPNDCEWNLRGLGYCGYGEMSVGQEFEGSFLGSSAHCLLPY
ncbi:hypothetical protein JAAARDRAFT_207374 [Jaapia argillacea MUCL 33604]|uniref:Sulfite oxidase n=1 Tax=Jaapia argillacea MUCL 33604 TaxID=933084 RepID=A0A067PT47_9AGAM|nr:hypothetical protein JAAARDRAFT_207374 [Jaapia argillacea MUCL 33604]